MEMPEIALVVGDEGKISVTGGTAGNIPVLPAGLADMRDVLGVMARLAWQTSGELDRLLAIARSL
jgi:hypothetical protein